MTQINNYQINLKLKNMIDEYDKNFNTFNDTFEEDENFNIFKEYFNTIINAYYHIKNINPFSLLFENNAETSNYIKFIENNLFSIKYFLKKFLVWDNLNEEIKKFYESLIKMYIIFNNVININDFEADKLNKINDKYIYKDIEIKKNIPFVYFELSNEFIYYYLNDDNIIIKNRSIDKFNHSIIILMSSNPEKFKLIKSLYKDYEIFKYIDKLIEFKKCIEELENKI